MTDKKDFNPEKDIEFSVVSKLKNKAQTSGNKLLFTESTSNVAQTSPGIDANPIIISNETHYRRGLFFDYNSNYFQDLFSQAKPVFPYVVVKDLNSLTQALKSATPQSLFINWSVNPKAYEQLLPQISAKFPSVHIIISGTDLTQAKAKDIKEKYSFVKNFLAFPTSIEQLKKLLQIS